ncbi:helix-turn-helix domain-containing protein [Streptosporangium saharense]|uniref:Transcriptional regulator with XRE-family HTH domain n=1 Tax=Streptosporangium saharense TaxID=1706840 RepID=A0A7W7QL17_9ACTN|nr:helix-turn-helix transcriptional regulator [Streptosporangium saharense]MBB4915550.1 transcriptional regulator with XRE-family HTH domain [Streptosporangium saharense]
MNQPLLGKQAVQALGIRLRDIRRDAGLSGRQLAEACGWGPPKVSKVEHGRQAPTETDVRDWCIACGAPSEIADLVAAVRSIDTQYLDWRRSLGTGTRRRQRANVSAYERTTLFRVWEPAVMPGLVQTHAYAHEILATVIDFHGIPDDVEAGVQARMEAQRVLTHGDRRFLLLIGEAALHTRVGDAGVMREQLGRLVEVARMPRVSLGVVSLSAPYTVPRNNGFTIYDARMVTVATYTAELTLRERHEVTVYEKAFDRLAALAVHGVAARTLIDRAISDLEEI